MSATASAIVHKDETNIKNEPEGYDRISELMKAHLKIEEEVRLQVLEEKAKSTQAQVAVMNKALPHIMIMGVYGEAHKHLYYEFTDEHVPMNTPKDKSFYWTAINVKESQQINVSLLTTTNSDQVLSVLRDTRPTLVILTGENINNTTFTNLLMSVLRYSKCQILCLVTHVERMLHNFITYPHSGCDSDDIETLLNKLQIMESKPNEPIFNPNTVNLFTDRMKTIVQEVRQFHSYIATHSLPFEDRDQQGEDECHRISFYAYTDQFNGLIVQQVKASPELRTTFWDTDEVINYVLTQINNSK
jgi:hypothetical protein